MALTNELVPSPSSIRIRAALTRHRHRVNDHPAVFHQNQIVAAVINKLHAMRAVGSMPKATPVAAALGIPSNSPMLFT